MTLWLFTELFVLQKKCCIRKKSSQKNFNLTKAPKISMKGVICVNLDFGSKLFNWQ